MKIDKNDNLTDLIDGISDTGDTEDVGDGEAITEDGDILTLGNPRRTHSQISKDINELEDNLNKYFRKNWGKTFAVPKK